MYGKQWTPGRGPSSLGGHECEWPEWFSITSVLITAKKIVKPQEPMQVTTPDEVEAITWVQIA